MNIATSCPIEKKSLNQPQPDQETPLISIPHQRAKLINCQTQKEQNQMLWEICVENGILCNMSDSEKEGIKSIKERFS